MTLPYFRVDDVNPAHVRFSLFVNGGHSGQLCLRVDEVEAFRTLWKGGWKSLVERTSRDLAALQASDRVRRERTEDTMSFDVAQERHDRAEPPEAADALCCHCGNWWTDHESIRNGVMDEWGYIEQFMCPDGSGAEYEEMTAGDAREDAAERRWSENR